MKELFNLVGLVGFFMFLVPFADLLLSLNFFSELRTAGLTPVPALQPGKERRRFVTSIVLNVLLCTILVFPAMMGGYLLLISKTLPQDTTGGIGLWSLLCGLVGLLALRISAGKIKGRAAEFGVRLPWRIFWKTALLTVTVFSGAYLMVFFADYLFQTDFRIWSFDLRIFSAAKIWVAVKYLPFFLVYYVVNSLMISRVTFANWSERKQTWMAVLIQCTDPGSVHCHFLPALVVQRIHILGSAPQRRCAPGGCRCSPADPDDPLPAHPGHRCLYQCQTIPPDG